MSVCFVHREGGKVCLSQEHLSHVHTFPLFVCSSKWEAKHDDTERKQKEDSAFQRFCLVRTILPSEISGPLSPPFTSFSCRHAPFCHTFIFLSSSFHSILHSEFLREKCTFSPPRIATKGEFPIHSLCRPRRQLPIAVGNVVCVGIRQTCDKSVSQGVSHKTEYN